jgi:hypothetical protein
MADVIVKRFSITAGDIASLNFHTDLQCSVNRIWPISDRRLHRVIASSAATQCSLNKQIFIREILHEKYTSTCTCTT